MIKIRPLVFTGVAGAILGLSACGGSSSSSSGSSTTTLSGTAAAGAPIIGQVTVKGSMGNTKTALIEANGNYSVDVTGLTAPYVLRAQGTVGGRTYNLHSYAAETDLGGTVNVTPFTDLIVSNAAGQLASSFFDSGNFGNLSTTEIDAQEEALQTKLQDVLTAVGVDTTIDLMNTAFSADHTALDAALDVIRIETDTATNVATITNLIDNTTLEDNVTVSDDNTSTLSVTSDLSTIQSDYAAISDRFVSLSTLFAGGLPTTTQLDPFFSTDFLDSDMGKSQFLTDISTDPSLVGLSFSHVTFKALDQNAGTATVSFHVGYDGVIEHEADTWHMVKNNGTWQMKGNQEAIDRWSGFVCDHVHMADGTQHKGCGIWLGVEDFDTGNNNGAGALADSAKVTLLRNNAAVTNGVVYLGVPSGGAAGELFIYDSDYSDDYIGLGTGADQIDPSLFQEGDVLQFDIYTAALNLTDPANPFVEGTPFASYTTTINSLPISDANSVSYPSATQATLDALAAYTDGNLDVAWTLPDGLSSDEVWFEVCDANNCVTVDDGAPSGSSTTVTLDTSSLTTAPYTKELRIYAKDSNDHSFMVTYWE